MFYYFLSEIFKVHINFVSYQRYFNFIYFFQNLFEALFDNCKGFKDKVNIHAAQELRLLPCGRDKRGVMYWWQMDDCANLRVYKDDQDEETWTLAAW